MFNHRLPTVELKPIVAIYSLVNLLIDRRYISSSYCGIAKFYFALSEREAGSLTGRIQTGQHDLAYSRP